MRIRFSLVLPAVGILLFAAVSLAAWRNRENHVSKNYFWWSSIRLNSDPQNHRPMDQTRVALQEMIVSDGTLKRDGFTQGEYRPF